MLKVCEQTVVKNDVVTVFNQYGFLKIFVLLMTMMYIGFWFNFINNIINVKSKLHRV